MTWKDPTLMRTAVALISLLSLPLLGCSEPSPGKNVEPDAPAATADAPALGVMLPTWKLEDVQPASPRTGQTYGLDTFTGRIIVVSLLEGF